MSIENNNPMGGNPEDANQPQGQNPQGQNPQNPLGNPQGQPNNMGTFSQEYRHSPVSARVPDRVSRGVLSTGVLVLDSPNEFVIDFMQALSRPFHVVARVVLTPGVMEQFVIAAKDNLSKYEQRFGPPPTLPKPPTDQRPTLDEIYSQFKLPDEMLSGSYANAVMVGHSASEFFFDFITNFYPTSCVSTRVFITAHQMPRLVDAVGTALQRYHQRYIAPRMQQGQSPQQNPQNPQNPQGKPPEPPNISGELKF